jgi:phenylalanyl-tRNA synthetase beta chain
MALFGGVNRNLSHHPVLPTPDQGAVWGAVGRPSSLTIEIRNPELCARYTGTVIRGVKIGPSPEWMQRRITLAGMRPINNVVDITNYVMLEMGQPLHAFDYNAVAEHKIVVRRAKEGEKITTLDHVERTLDTNMLVICDVERPVALAGVMGGLDSEITTEEGAVVDVLLESAHFDPRSIRRTARLLRLPSEASYRFERFVDPNLTVPALQRAAELMRELAGGTIAEGYVDVYPRPAKPERMLFYTSEVERLLGIKVGPTQIAEVLRRLDFGVEIPHNADTVGRDTTLIVEVPTYRNDVTIQADLVEEVARITGYDLIPETLLYGGLPPQEVNVSLEAETHLRDLAVECGMDEVINYSVTWSEELARLEGVETTDDGRQTTDENAPSPVVRRPSSVVPIFQGRPVVTIVNPVSSRQDVMRPTLLPNMMSTLRDNLKMQPETPIRIFELGKVYLTPTVEEIEARREAMRQEREKYPRMKAWDLVPNEDLLPIEPRRLAGMISGPRTPRSLYAPDSAAPAAQADFFDAKGVVEELLGRLHIAGVEWSPANSPHYHPGWSATISAQGVELGIVGELHPRLIEQWEIPAERVAAWDLDVEALLSVLPDRVRYKTISPYPPVRQDMAFVVSEEVEVARVAQAIRKAGGEAVKDVSLFDIYRDKPIPEGKKSLAFAVTLNSLEKPLSEDEVARIRKKIEGFLSREFGATLRS